MTDRELVDFLSDSTDLDDYSLCLRYRILEKLKAKPDRSRTEEYWLGVLESMLRIELDWLKQPTAVRIATSRPCWPRWHWPQELELLLQS